MIRKNFTPYLWIAVLCLMAQTNYAVAPNKAILKKDGVTTVEAESNSALTTTLSKKQLRKKARKAKRQERIQKILAKIQKKMPAVDFQDPVKKWMWFWLFGWGAGVVLSILAGAIFTGSVSSGNAGGIGGSGFIWLLASLAYLFGTVALVIWVIKAFG